MIHRIKRLEAPSPVRLAWYTGQWRKISPLKLTHAMGLFPSHFPEVNVKLAYNSEALFAVFRVKDQFVRAVTKQHQGAVYQDSCVEFFFTPESEKQQRYFNLEINCSGTMLFHYQESPRQSMPVPESALRRINVVSTLPAEVTPEYTAPLTWLVSWRMPFDILSTYPGFSSPQSGTVWHANFYKCADKCSHPHWLTWAKVDSPKPDFHRPDCFGKLIFG